METLDTLLPVADFDDVFDAVSDVHRSSGFEAGYRRAVNDMLADLALVTAEVLREVASEDPELRRAVRLLQRRFEQHLDGNVAGGAEPRRVADGYVDGGLGI